MAPLSQGTTLQQHQVWETDKAWLVADRSQTVYKPYNYGEIMKLCIHFIRICFVRACYIKPEVDVVFAKDLYFVEYNQILNQTGVYVETRVGKAT